MIDQRRNCVYSLLAVVATVASCRAQSLLSPRLYEPTVVASPLHESAVALSPDQRLMVFGRSNPQLSVLMVSRQDGSEWSAPTVAPFSGQWLDMEAAFSPDGRWVYFASNRPYTPGGKPVDGGFGGKLYPGRGAHLWRVEVKGGRFGVPEHLGAAVNSSGAIYAPSITADGTLWFMKPGPSGKFAIYRLKDGSEVPEYWPINDPATSNVDPAVAPDESLVVFGSGRKPARGMDLFVSFKLPGGWSCALHLGDDINSEGSDAEPRLVPDGKTLLFSSERVVGVDVIASKQDMDAALRRGLEWDNGLYNVWSVQISDRLTALKVKAALCPPVG